MTRSTRKTDRVDLTWLAELSRTVRTCSREPLSAESTAAHLRSPHCGAAIWQPFERMRQRKPIWQR